MTDIEKLPRQGLQRLIKMGALPLAADDTAIETVIADAIRKAVKIERESCALTAEIALAPTAASDIRARAE